MSEATKPRHPTNGLGVDAHGGPVVDPTENVKELSKASALRQDDLRAKDREISDLQHRHQAEVTSLRAEHLGKISELREQYQEKIAHAESNRLDSIRQVDREEVAKTAVAANTAIAVLAKQTTDLAATLDKKVTDTAVAADARNTAQYSETNKRLSALELSSSEGKGKQTLADPQMERLTELVAALARSQATGAGKSEGVTTSWGLMISIVVAGAIVGGTLLAGLSMSRATPAAQPQPQIIYVPAPATVGK